MKKNTVSAGLLVLFFLVATVSGQSGQEQPVVSQWPEHTDSEAEFAANFQGLASMTWPLYSSGGTPEVLSFERSHTHKHIWLLKYFSGCAGTSTIYWIYRAKVIDMSRNTILGDAIYHEQIGPPKPGSPLPCNWLWKKNEVIIPCEDNEPISILLPDAAIGSQVK